MLSQSQLQELFEYDPETGIFINIKTGLPILTMNSGRIRIFINGDKYYAAQLAWLYMTGQWPKDQIDHVNGDRSDDRWVNLRQATQSQNMQNRTNWGKYKKGVTFDPRGYANPYQARIQIDGVSKDLGKYATEDGAHEAYCKAAQEHHGEFANTEEFVPSWNRWPP